MITEKYTEDGKFAWQRDGRQPYSGPEIYRMVIEWYGGKCLWCGIDDIRVLALDHVYPKGHPKRLADNMHQVVLAKWIIRNIVYGKEDKGAFRVLCRNCDWLAYTNTQEKPNTISWGKR